MELAVHPDIKWLPVVRADENKIVLSEARHRLQQQYNDHTDLRHGLGMYDASVAARSNGLTEFEFDDGFAGITGSKNRVSACGSMARTCKLRKTIVKRKIRLSIIYYILAGCGDGRVGPMMEGQRSQGETIIFSP